MQSNSTLSVSPINSMVGGVPFMEVKTNKQESHLLSGKGHNLHHVLSYKVEQQ